MLKGFSVVLPALLKFADFLKEKVAPAIKDYVIVAIEAFKTVLVSLADTYREKLKPAIDKLIGLLGGGSGEGGRDSLKG